MPRSLSGMLEAVPSAEEMSRHVNATLNGIALPEMDLQIKHTMIMGTFQDWMQKLDQYIEVCAAVKQWAQRLDLHLHTHFADDLCADNLVPTDWKDQLHSVQVAAAGMQCNSMTVSFMLMFLRTVSEHLLGYAGIVDAYREGHQSIMRRFARIHSVTCTYSV